MYLADHVRACMHMCMCPASCKGSGRKGDCVTLLGSVCMVLKVGTSHDESVLWELVGVYSACSSSIHYNTHSESSN